MKRVLIIAALGFTQIAGYGTLYYAFSVLAPEMTQDMSWSREWVFGALSLALICGGLVAPHAGRLIDRHGGGRVMAAGSLAAALALIGCAFAPGKTSFVLGLVAVEMTSSFVQYSAAFALLVQLDHRRASRDITYLTLIAGFASTIFWPLTAWMQTLLSWREIYLVFAGIHLLACLPIHLWLSTLPRDDGRAGAVPGAPPLPSADGALPPQERKRGFLLVAVGFSLLSFVNGAILVHMLPMLGALGLGAMAVLVSTLFGPAQVASRLINMIFGAGLSAAGLAVLAAGLQPLGLAILLASAPWLPGAIAFALLFGFGSGLMSILQGTLPLHLFGRDGYGERTGRLASVRLIVTALAPFIYALLLERFGIAVALGVTAGLGAGAVVTFLWLARAVARQRLPAPVQASAPAG